MPDSHDLPIIIQSEFDSNIGNLSEEVWKDLRLFLSVVRTGSFRRAAEELGVSTLTVSRRVKHLQDVLGSQLVVGSQKGAILTAKGEALARTLTQVDRDLRRATGGLKAETATLEGIVTVSITEGLAVVFLVPALSVFSRQNPNISIRIRSVVRTKDLRENQTDLVLSFRPESAQDLTCRELGRAFFVPTASRSYLDRRGVPTMADIAQHEFVNSEQYQSFGSLWKDWHGLLAAGGRISHTTDTSMSYSMMIKAGLGIGLLGNYATIEPSVVAVDLPVNIAVPLYSVALTERLNSKPVRKVFDFVSVLFGPENPWFVSKQGARRDSAPSRFQPESFDL